MKKIKYLTVFTLLFFMFIQTASAAKCRDLDYNACIGATDDSGVSCTNTVIDSKTVCAPASCSAYNFISVYEYDINSKTLLDCEKDSRCKMLEGVCVSKKTKNKSNKYTCEDWGYTRDIWGTGETCYSQIGSECAVDESGLCYTVKKDDSFKLCVDYTTEDDCDAHEKDDGGNTCGWDSSAKKCKEVISQDDINSAATTAKTKGEDPEKAAKAEKDKQVAEIVKSNAKFKCSDVRYLTTAWFFIRIAAPFIIILFGSLDFFKAVAAGDEKKMKESKTNFIKRLIAFLLLILLPFIVQFIFSVMGTYGSNNVCLVKCIATNNTSNKGCD